MNDFHDTADLPTDDMVQNWNEANDYTDEAPADNDPGPPTDLDVLALADTLRATAASLDEHIEHRAHEIAAPRIAAAEQRAAKAEHDARRAEQQYEQRLEALRRELGRRLASLEKRADKLHWLSAHLPEPLRQLVGPVPAHLAKQLDPEWVATVARRADPGYNPEAEAQLRLLTDAITMVVTTKSAARLQTRMRVGFSTAQRLLQQMEDHGVVGPERSRRPREVLLTRDQLPALLAELAGAPTP
ncbi:DNA translocase FtsK [Nonomuraea sp. NPDC003214]